jgi:hypothetical protein
MRAPELTTYCIDKMLESLIIIDLTRIEQYLTRDSRYRMGKGMNVAL